LVEKTEAEKVWDTLGVFVGTRILNLVQEVVLARVKVREGDKVKEGK